MTITVATGSGFSWQNVLFTPAATFSNVNGGTNFPANTKVVAACSFSNNESGVAGNPPPTMSVTIGGQPATWMGHEGIGNVIQFWQADMPGTSQTDTVVISDSNSVGNWVGVGVWILTGAAAGFTPSYGTNIGSITANHSNLGADPVLIEAYNATDDGGNGSAISLTVPTGGVGLAALFSANGVAGTSNPVPTWATGGTSNITSSSGDVTNNSVTHPVQQLMAHSTTVGSWAPLVSGSPAYTGAPNFGAAMLAAVISPAGAAARTPTLTLMGVG